MVNEKCKQAKQLNLAERMSMGGLGEFSHHVEVMHSTYYIIAQFKSQTIFSRNRDFLPEGTADKLANP